MELLRCLAVAPCTCFCIRPIFPLIKMNQNSRHPSALDGFHLGTAAGQSVEDRVCFDFLCGSICRLVADYHLLRAISLLILTFLSGCNFIPDIKHKPQYHNPFPQISKVAILPFRNQSQEPTLSGARVSMAYYNELQAIRGFEVVPCGVVENQLAFFEMNVLRRPIMSPVDFQQFAKYLGVDAVLQGAITDYDAYYPPRMTMKVNWYAANPGFHPIPVGYGLPWGTKKEKNIREWIRLESERALAAEQMKSQTPEEVEPKSPVELNPDTVTPKMTTSSNGKSSSNTKQGRVAAARIELPISAIASDDQDDSSRVLQASATQEPTQESTRTPESIVGLAVRKPNPMREPNAEPAEGVAPNESDPSQGMENAGLPANWPDPQGFIPQRPTPQAPPMKAQSEPIISHMRTYNGNDEDFTQALEEYFYFRDDARFGGWQAYLQRSEDFIRFCCHQHIVETLESRGGSLESRMIFRWPVGRYER